MAVATRAHRQGSQPWETSSSCFDKQTTRWCQEPSSWVKTPTAVPSLSYTYRKEDFYHIWQAQSRVVCKCPLNFFKDLFLLLYLYNGFLFSPTLWLIRGFCQERVIGDPDPAET
jgi:hypothetical protein